VRRLIHIYHLDLQNVSYTTGDSVDVVEILCTFVVMKMNRFLKKVKLNKKPIIKYFENEVLQGKDV